MGSSSIAATAFRRSAYETRCYTPALLSGLFLMPLCAEVRGTGLLRSSRATLGGSGDVLPKQLLAPDADRGVAMDQFPFTVLPTEHAGITEGYLPAIG